MPGIVEQPAMLKSPASSQALEFEEAPLPAVLKTLQSTYGLELWMENQKLNNCVFTGDLNGLPFPIQLELICKAINATSSSVATGISRVCCVIKRILARERSVIIDSIIRRITNGSAGSKFQAFCCIYI